VSALPVRAPARAVAGSAAAAQWAQIQAAAPDVAAAMQRYLQRLGVFLAPASVDSAENALRQLARWMITDAGLDSIAGVCRDDIEDYKVWLAAQPRAGGQTIAAETHRQRMRTVRAFFERIIEWDWPDAPARNPVIAGDIPKKPEPLPKFLDDRDAARLMTAARASLWRQSAPAMSMPRIRTRSCPVGFGPGICQPARWPPLHHSPCQLRCGPGLLASADPDSMSFGVPDVIYGEEINAAVILRSGQTATERELTEYCLARLSTFEVPKRFFFVTSIPRTAKGAGDRHARAEAIDAVLAHDSAYWSAAIS
jgi:hypothetical protein